MKEQRRSHALAEELRRTKVEGVLNATIGKEALSTGVPASKEDVETRRDDVSETTASSSSAEAVVAIFREHVVDTQGLLEDEMANVNTVLDVQEEVLHALRRVTEDRTDLRTRLKIKQSETDQVRRDLENAEAQVATVTEELRASEEKASLQNGELSGLLSKLQASQDDLQQQLLHTQAALQAQEQQKMSDSAVAAEATQSLQAANAALQTKIDELQSQVEAKQKELAALAETLQDGSAHAQQVQSEAACFDISTPRSSKSPWAESPEAAQVAEVAGAEQSGLLAENRLLRERLSAFEEEKATSLQALREQVMLLARENYDLKHGVRQAEASPVEAKEVPAGSGAASEGDQRWWLSAIFSPFLTEGDMREIHAQSRLDEADG